MLYPNNEFQKIAPNLSLKQAKFFPKFCNFPPNSGDITRFFPWIDQIFPGEAIYPFFGAQDEGFSEFRSR